MVMNMNRNSIRWRLTLSYAAIALLAAFSLGLVLRTILRNYYDGQEERYLQTRAVEISSIASQLLDADLSPQMIQDLSQSWSLVLQARVRVLDTEGHQVADSGVPETQKVLFIASEKPFRIPVGESESAPAKTNRFFQVQVLKGEPEIGFDKQKDVFVISRGEVGVAMSSDVSMSGLIETDAGTPARRSEQMVRQPVVGQNRNLLGTVILSEGPAYGDEILHNVMNGWVLASIAAVLLAALAGWLVSTRIATPLTELTTITARMSQGDLSARADVRSRDEIGTLGRSFNEMAGRVEETVGTLRSFVADAAHELHTPLAALLANIELAHNEKNASARTRYLIRAQEQGQRLEGLVQSLLALSRLEAAESKSAFAPVDLSQLVREVGEMLASRSEQANRFFKMEIPEQAVQIQGNETQLRQVITNLLENALKFTPAGGWIALVLERVDDQVRLTVSDSGIGIPAEDLPHLFERFHRGHNAAEYAGNGLGLAIVKAIVAAHRGQVAVRSEAMQGTSISVSLPIQ